jgi:hypothetical protein
MDRRDRRKGGTRRAAAVLAALIVAFGAMALGSVGSSGAQAGGLSGGAYGYYTSVGLFGGPAGPNGPAPKVDLPPTGADPPLTATNPTASAIYGPAVIFGGKAPEKAASNVPSGPIKVSTAGKAGAGGFVTSTVDIGKHPTPVGVPCENEPAESTNCKAIGGFGPNPPTAGDELHATCSADGSGATGSTRFVNAVIALSTDTEGNPTGIEPVPDNPPANYTKEGQLTNVGDNFRIVYNEQIKAPDGSITVNAVHMYLLGPIAVGESIIGQVRCSTGGAVPPGPSVPTTPTSSAPTTSVTSPSSSAPPNDEEESTSSALPLALGGGGAVAVGAAGLALWARSRRRKPTGGEPPVSGSP